nr:MAG TPA: hypothetical protein [Caudoviricetes sp.]
MKELGPGISSRCISPYLPSVLINALVMQSVYLML